ncbi:MAG: dTDP-4-dehydrorhamnose 3,5-epimerase [Alphaproteobacteria bacterium]|nr:dTDP-4-dehydrorhamnose 3,5-epimerase [Alphaproteobacteria bacterium]
MEIESLAIPEVKLVTPRRFADERGFFCESYNAARFAEAGLGYSFVQDNHSLSRARHTVRGLHYQAPPFAQTKLVRPARGRILDVAVDVRVGSPTYGRHVSAVLSAEDATFILVPVGFLHGFLTLEPDTEVVYKVDAYYSKPQDGGVFFADPDLGIDWGIAEGAAVLSAKDAGLPRFAEFVSPFVYREGAHA